MKFNEYAKGIVGKVEIGNGIADAAPMVISCIESCNWGSDREYILITFKPCGMFYDVYGIPQLLTLSLYDQSNRIDDRVKALRTISRICDVCGVKLDEIVIEDVELKNRKLRHSILRSSLIHQLYEKLVGKTLMVSTLFEPIECTETKVADLKIECNIDLDDAEFDVPPKKKAMKWSEWVNEVSEVICGQVKLKLREKP